MKNVSNKLIVTAIIAALAMIVIAMVDDLAAHSVTTCGQIATAEDKPLEVCVTTKTGYLSGVTKFTAEVKKP